jgi:hypothetical protein
MSKNEYADFKILEKPQCEHDALISGFIKTVLQHNIFCKFGKLGGKICQDCLEHNGKTCFLL